MREEGHQHWSDLNCIDCGKSITAVVGGVAICMDCLAVRGSCCAEFGGNDLTADAEEPELPEPRENASPVCYAPLFEDEAATEDADTVRHDVTRRRFHTATDAYLDYERTTPGELEITHTYVPEDQRGKGLAQRLMEAVVDYAKRENLQLRAACSYAEAYLRKHG